MTEKNVAPTRPDPPPTRAVGVILIATVLATYGLLANHPGGVTGGFAELLKSEAANQMMDAIVHGGFIVVLSIQLVCFAVFSTHLCLRRTSVIAGLVFFAIGAVMLSLSLVIDGLVTPAVAVRYASAASDKLEFARSLFVLCGALVRFLMPIGLAFQAAAILGWSTALLGEHGFERAAGVLGAVVFTLTMAALAADFTGMGPYVLMAALIGLALWYVAVGVILTIARS
jgi:hypothetical protein